MRTEVGLSCSLKDTAFHHHCFKQWISWHASCIEKHKTTNYSMYIARLGGGAGDGGLRYIPKRLSNS